MNTMTTACREPQVRLSELAGYDIDELKLMLQRCSVHTLRGRFGTYSTVCAQHYLDSVHDAGQITIVARTPRGQIVGVATVYFDEQPEIAVLVEDRWQYRGVGRRLIRRACAIAARNGITTLYAQITTTNVAAYRVLRRSCDYTRIHYRSSGEATVAVQLDAWIAS